MFGFDSYMIFRIPALLIALTFHEYAHARVAASFGDPTPRALGRLTLNPVAHLDPIGLLMLWLFQFGWAKPVPVNPNNFYNRRRGMFWVALAGPLSNVLIAFTVAVLKVVFLQLNLLSFELQMVLDFTYTYNLMFAVFNLMPLPPLDGSKVLSSLWPQMGYWFERIEPYATFVLMGLMFTGVFSMIIYPAVRALSFIIKSVILIFV
ncbi:MAG: site-2 protease family protein [Sporomusaceae bacterium]|nr:site-2 protease family protein [Sporomusaceae bacterium]